MSAKTPVTMDLTRTMLAVLFTGPIVLAVSCTLLESWVLGNGREEAAGGDPNAGPP